MANNERVILTLQDRLSQHITRFAHNIDDRKIAQLHLAPHQGIRAQKVGRRTGKRFAKVCGREKEKQWSLCYLRRGEGASWGSVACNAWQSMSLIGSKWVYESREPFFGVQDLDALPIELEKLIHELEEGSFELDTVGGVVVWIEMVIRRSVDSLHKTSNAHHGKLFLEEILSLQLELQKEVTRTLRLIKQERFQL